ncbi:helix-turn-helix transcriptional regulator [uncultured Erythrobacter sp.]|uniref:response regulator transcription factor n=1 Tax=uncultured Erythrobacter sp. TaxID=263913 RepID=UPI0026187110|nr:helix-turn-helix transcriptional regulator [uncultured Erythrobacter sp.]
MIIDNDDEPLHLTLRETEILKLAALGLTTKEMAQRAGIAPSTVERHIENTRLKMRAKNRVHMISKAIAAGLLTVEDSERTIEQDPNKLSA